MNEQRHGDRVPFESALEQFLLCGPGYPTRNQDDEFIDARAHDLSAGGIGCSSSRPLEPLIHVFVMFRLPAPGGERLIKAEGYVAHSRRDGNITRFGVSFDALAPEERAAIAAYVAERAAR